MTWKCLLNLESVLIGYEEIDPAAVQPGDVVFDEKPDLPMGQYRWDGEKFVPITLLRGLSPDGPDPWFAFYRLCRRLEKQNVVNIPAPTKLWMEYYRKSFTSDPVTEA